MARRTFLTNTAKIAATASILAGAKKVAAGEQPQETKNTGKPPKFIIDAHIHAGSNDQWVEDMVKIYRPRNAMAFVLTWMKEKTLIDDAAKSYPDIFIKCGRIDLDNENAIREVETFKKDGYVGMKFHSPRYNYDDPTYFQIYRLCEEYRMHMLFHTGISSHRIKDDVQWTSSARMRPIYLDTLCRVFPRTTMQGAHFGNPWYPEAAEAARWNPTLYFDITGSTLLKFIKLGKLKIMSEYLWWQADEAEKNPHTLKNATGAWEHIVFGTDEKPTGLEPNIERFQKMLDENNVPENTRENMWGLTIARVLGIDPKSKKFIEKK
jgi:predicted TIM-barrel fold metal-dependent hydrolase